MEKSYALPKETIPSLDLAHQLSDLIELRKFLGTRGISTQNTRIDRYIKYLDLACAHGPSDAARVFRNSLDARFQDPIDWLLYVLREVHELTWILRGLLVTIPSGLDEKLRFIVSGKDFAALDGDSRSRDIQFELRIASYFCQAGCEVHLSEETDIIALTDTRAFYLECKRIQGMKQIDKRLTEAKKQLKQRIPLKRGKRKAYGCIAADVTKVGFAENGLTLGLTNDHSRDVIQEKLILISRHAQRIPLFEASGNILFYWLQIHIPALILHPLTPATRFSSLQILKPVLDRRQRGTADEFYEIFGRISENVDPRTLPSRELTLRTGLQLPKGSSFHTTPRLLAGPGNIAGPEGVDDVALGTLSFDGKDHDFTLGDFRMLPESVHSEWGATWLSDPVKAGLALLIEMYIQRFPYVQCKT